MKRWFDFFLCSLAALMTLSLFSTTPAHAQSYLKTFVAMTGNDANDCHISRPCHTVYRAYNQTFSGGEVVCLDASSLDSSWNITKPITISCEDGSLYGLTVNIVAGQRVVLRGLVLNGGGGNAVNIPGAGTVVLDHLRIGGGQGSAVRAAPNGPLNLTVSNSIITGAGIGTTYGAGLQVLPAAGGTAQVTLDHVVISANPFGVAFDGSGSTGGINATIKDSVFSGNNQDGIVATTTSGHAPIGVLISNSTSSNNGFGVRSIGQNVTVRVKGSEIIGNGTGMAASGGGALLSLGSNVVRANGSDGAFTGSLPLQ